ncbi:uncharacterized protein E0L32_010680, partial [Thyridium curvatum]
AARLRWRRWRARSMAPEPPAGSRDVVRVALKLPEGMGGGERIRRAFAAGTTLEELYAFVECYDVVAQRGDDDDDVVEAPPEGYVHDYRFRIAAVMPREVFEPTAGATVLDKIGRSGNLVVEMVVPEEEEDEEEEEEKEEKVDGAEGVDV